MKFTNFNNIDSLEDIKDLFKDNKHILDYLEEYEGFDNFLGSGEYGKVWKIKGKELTLKITRDQSEILSSNRLSGRDTKAFLKIYSTANIGNIQLKIQEMCYPTQNAELAAYVHGFFMRPEEKTVDNFKKWVEEYKVVVKVPSDSEIERYFRFTDNLLNDCEKYLDGRESYDELDIHKGNVMQTKTGELKLVDF